jgi:AAA+ superfamily predicted ATPase
LSTADPLAGPVLAAAERTGGGPPPLFVLRTGRGGGAWLGDALAAAGRAVCIADASRAEELSAAKLHETGLGWLRAALLEGAVLIVVGLDGLPVRERTELVRLLAEGAAAEGPLLVLQGREIGLDTIGSVADGVRLIEPDAPSRTARAQTWRCRAAAAGIALDDEDSLRLASTFAFDRVQVDAAIAVARAASPACAPEADAMHAAVRSISHMAVPHGVRRIDSPLGWDDLVVAEATKAELRAIPVQVQMGARVWDQWGFARRAPYGQGVAALFAGPSGTGKTMAAQIVASEMGVPLFQVDLAQTVSKYIGETEKALAQIFEAAACNGAVLLFDEADALFGKRSEVKDAHDRYANIEVAYLLQQMEEYRGLAVLTSNAKQNVDSAFLRRLRFVVDFAAPEAAERLAIWKGMFPADAPLAKDVDFTFLARRLPLTGGNIQQIALRAAFDAAADRGAITMAHILAATRRELSKLGMQSAERFIAEAVPPAEAAG